MKRNDAMRDLLDRWRDSGLSLMAFGRREGMPYSRLLYWKKKFEREGPTADRTELVPIDLVPEAPAASVPAKVEVWLPNGIGLDVGPGFDAEELRRIVGLLQTC